MEENVEKKMSNFSVPLGLVDYINPIFYGITTFTIIKNMYGIMNVPSYVLFIIGAILSLIFGLTIPTVKLLVGLGKFEFKMPVNLVFFVNLGLFLSGLTLFKFVFNINLGVMIIVAIVLLAMLSALYFKKKKFNTIAVLIGAFGYVFIYTSLITMSIRNKLLLPVILYAVAICLFVFLCMVGIKANLKDARVHWVIEISNVVCQLLVAVSTILLFY